jgi:hypothetical protein
MSKSKNYLDSLAKGWMLFCPTCREFVQQSDPQNLSLGKTVVIDDESCHTCIVEAQQLLGRLGITKGDSE